MDDKEKIIQELLNRIETLSRQQTAFQAEIRKLQNDVYRLKIPGSSPGIPSAQPLAPTAETKAETVPKEKTVAPVAQRIDQPARRRKTPWDEFIGTNLLNKAGIAVLVIGIGFGTKYSIDHQLINPLTRIILGYLAGLTLTVFAYRLKNSLKSFSAVLLSGGMTVLYFITYAAYDFYGLIPQAMAFAMMVMFTVFTVFAAVQYNLEVIGVIGLVGAYAVPLLLSDGSGRVVILFTYMSIINTGILFLAFKRYWKRLYYLAFILTWLTFSSWHIFSFDADTHLSISLLFSTVFFLTFYTTFLVYKLIRREHLERWDVIYMLLNSFIYFGFGYATMSSTDAAAQYLGLFCVSTALIHFVAVVIIRKQQERFDDMFYFAAGLVLVFLTIAVPVQLEGNWVTLVWAGEAALLFWIGRSKGFLTYEKLSYPLIGLAFLSLLHDWSRSYPDYIFAADSEDQAFTIFLNIQFLTSMLVGAAFLFIFYLNRMNDGTRPVPTASPTSSLLSIGLPVLTLVVIYFGFFKEIQAFWDHRYAASKVFIQGAGYDQYDYDLRSFKTLWLMIYSALFASILSLIQCRVKSRLLGHACLAMNTLVMFTFITAGLLELSALRSSYLGQDLAAYYHRDYGHLSIRYVSVFFMLPLLWLSAKLSKERFFNDTVRKGENLFFHFAILVLMSSELIHWLDMARVENSFKLSLSILWGAYALFLIVLGLSRDQKHIRLGAIVLFAATLLKLFVYDMADMSTILKTVVMMVLGVLLLTASFIYNKYKRPA